MWERNNRAALAPFVLARMVTPSESCDEVRPSRRLRPEGVGCVVNRTDLRLVGARRAKGRTSPFSGGWPLPMKKLISQTRQRLSVCSRYGVQANPNLSCYKVICWPRKGVVRSYGCVGAMMSWYFTTVSPLTTMLPLASMPVPSVQVTPFSESTNDLMWSSSLPLISDRSR